MRSTSRLMRFILAVSLIIVFAAHAPAQTGTATLQGTIMDTGGGVVPGVTVKIESPATGLTREAVTNSSGLYVYRRASRGATRDATSSAVAASARSAAATAKPHRAVNATD